MNVCEKGCFIITVIWIFIFPPACISELKLSQREKSPTYIIFL